MYAELIVDPTHIRSNIGVALRDKVKRSVIQITVPQKLDIHVEHNIIGFPQ